MMRWILIFCLAGLPGCKEQPVQQAHVEAAQGTAGPAPKLRVHPEESGLVFRYFEDGQRKPKTALSIDKVPKQSRDLVLVVPESIELAAGTVAVADLRKAKADGSYPYKLVPVAQLDRQIDERFKTQDSSSTAKANAPQSTKALSKKAGGPNNIILFSASWCGVCTQARRWFNNKGIPFVEKDVEKAKGARREMHELAKKAGVDPSQLTGVPVIWIKGKLLMGFNPQTIERLLANLSSS
jgi:glutaredoxin